MGDPILLDLIAFSSGRLNNNNEFSLSSTYSELLMYIHSGMLILPTKISETARDTT